MNRLAISSLAITFGLLLGASQCKDAVDNLTPDINTTVSSTFNVNVTTSEAVGLDTLNPNDDTDFRNNKSKLKYITVTQARVNVEPGTFPADRLVNLVELSYAHPDSSRFISLGQLTNIKLSDMTSAQAFPATEANLVNLATLLRTSDKGVKYKYKFSSDGAPLIFQGKVSFKLALKLK